MSVVVVDGSGRVLEAATAVCEALDLRLTEPSPPWLCDIMSQCLTSGQPAVVQVPLENGPCSVRASVERLHGGPEEGRLAVLLDGVCDLPDELGSLLGYEDRYRLLAQSSMEGVLVHENHICLECNDALSELVGMPRSALLGRYFLDFVAPEDRRQVDERVANASAEAYEVGFITADGRRRVVRICGRTVSRGDRRLRVASIRDVTEYRRAEARLAQAAEVSQALADVSRMLLVSDAQTDVSRKLLDHALRLTGSTFGLVAYHIEESDKLICPASVAPADSAMESSRELVLDQMSQPWQWLTQRRETILCNDLEHDERFADAPDKPTYVRSFLAAPALLGSDVVGLVSVANGTRPYDEEDQASLERLAALWALWQQRRQDNERRQAAQREAEALNRSLLLANQQLELAVAQAEQLAQDAERANQIKAEFLANMSHELRTPLNAVIGMTELLSDTRLSEEQRDYAETVHDAGTSLLGIINDVLDFSRLDAGKMTLEALPFDLGAAVDDVVALLAPKAEERGLEVVVRCDPDLPLQVVGDPVRVRQVLTNLVGNALKFTEAGHVFVHIQTESLAAEQAVYRLSVQDTGIGIAPDVLPRVFDKFTQADGSSRRSYGGTGLGLAITRQLVEQMGGTIGVNSELGVGSTFHFTLPLPLDRSAPAALPAAELDAVPVLVVDESPASRRVLVDALAHWQMSCDEVGDTAAALDKLRAAAGAGNPFGLVLMDRSEPTAAAEELARAVKADGATAGAVLVLLTSVGQRGEADQMHQAGYAAYLSKPYRLSQLREVLSAVWGARRQGTQLDLVTRHTVAEAAARRERRAEASDAPRGQVLLVEDNIVNQKVAIRMLEKLGCAVELAGSGQQGLEMWTSRAYDIIFMDCQMPELDGCACTQEIRRRENGGGRTPIVAMTANAMPGDREACLDAGMDDYLAKPVRSSDLSRVLERWLPASAAPLADGVPLCAAGE